MTKQLSGDLPELQHFNPRKGDVVERNLRPFNALSPVASRFSGDSLYKIFVQSVHVSHAVPHDSVKAVSECPNIFE